MKASITWDHLSGTAAPRECFADEIAIDFPSVGAVVERMRDAFFGDDEPGDCIATELAISPDEAARGITLPFDVPMRTTCRHCGGRGERWNDPCDACCTSGESLVHHTVSMTVPAGVADGARFRFRVSSPHAAPVRVEVRVALRSSSSFR
jgi:hypothetical protein